MHVKIEQFQQEKIQIPKKVYQIQNREEIQRSKKITTGIRKKLEEFQFSKFDLYKNLDNVLFLMGTSRAGKSALSLMIQEINMQAKKQNGTYGPIVLESSNKQYHGIVGHGKKAKTKMPNICEIYLQNEKKYFDNYFLADCPGLLDSEGFQDDFTNSYFVMKVFEIVKKARFLLCIPQNQFKGNMDPLVKSLQGFLKYFKKNTPNLKQIINATSLVITQTLQFSSEGQTVCEYLDDIKTNLQSKGLTNCSLLITELINSGRVYYQEKAKIVQKQFSLSIGKQIKERQLRNQFYQINREQDIDFQFDCQKNQETANQFDRMHQHIVQQIKEYCKILVQCFEQVAQNISKETDKKNFMYFQTIREFVAVKDIYSSANNLEGRKKKIQQVINKFQFKEEQHDFAGLIFLRNIYQAMKKFESTQPYDTKSLVYFYFSNILTYLYAKHDTKDIYNLAFLVNRNFEELRIIEKIKANSPKSYPEIHGQAQISSAFNIKQYQDKFIRNFKVKGGNSQLFYKLAADFFQTFQSKAIKNQIDKKIHQIEQNILTEHKNQQLKLIKIQEQLFITIQKINQIKEQLQVQKNNLQQPNLLKLKEKKCKLQQLTTQQFQKHEMMKQVKVESQITIEHLKQVIEELKQQRAKVGGVERIRQNIIINLKYQSAKVFQKNKKLPQAINQYEKCRKMTQEFNKAQNLRNYQIVEIKIYQSLGKLCEFQIKNYGLAIQYFKVVGNILPVKRCFQKYRNSCSDKQVIDVFVQNANFLSMIGQHQAGRQLLWAAYQRVLNSQELATQKQKTIKRLKKEEFKLQSNKDNNYKSYLEKLQNGKFFDRPNQAKIVSLKQQQKRKNGQGLE